jgi:hypothetical protein
MLSREDFIPSWIDWLTSPLPVRSTGTPCVADVRGLALPPDILVAVGRFIRDADVRGKFVPLLYRQFDAIPSSRPFLALE